MFTCPPMDGQGTLWRSSFAVTYITGVKGEGGANCVFVAVHLMLLS
jgi:hypothetical protein